MESIKNILPGLLRNLQSPAAQKQNELFVRWGEIVGPAFAQQTKPSLGKRKELLIWVKDSALAFEMNQKYKGTILKRVRALLGEDAVEKVMIRVGQLR
ncbi:MAG: DUF721 domain-containing protein [Candidatus Omnitrophota bacterium]|jgi:hypothetical protein